MFVGALFFWGTMKIVFTVRRQRVLETRNQSLSPPLRERALKSRHASSLWTHHHRYVSGRASRVGRDIQKD